MANKWNGIEGNSLMNQLTLRIELSDGTVLEVLSSAGDIVKWETHFNIGIDKLEKVTHLLYLAWLAVVRLKKTGETFDDWIELVAKVEVVDPKE
jgi:hypothetical protein